MAQPAAEAEVGVSDAKPITFSLTEASSFRDQSILEGPPHKLFYIFQVAFCAQKLENLVADAMQGVANSAFNQPHQSRTDTETDTDADDDDLTTTTAAAIGTSLHFYPVGDAMLRVQVDRFVRSFICLAIIV